MKNLYIYFSGTGNTKYVLESFAKKFEETDAYNIFSIEHKGVNFTELIKKARTITIGYPIYCSMMPFMMRDFLKEHIEDFEHKAIITIATQMLFSGDGGTLAKRTLKKAHVDLLHSIHVNMPSNLTDVSLLKNLQVEETNSIVKKADKKIDDSIKKIRTGKYMRDGRKIYSWFLGFFTQRLWGKLFLQSFREKIKINQDTCITCKKCINVCPMNNLYLEDNIIKQRGNCTWCYRCINSCPEKSISLFTKKTPKVQYIREEYN